MCQRYIDRNHKLTVKRSESIGPDQGLALASKVEEVNTQEESNNSIYAGVAFGVIGAIAAGALINNCSKKRINPKEEPLL